MKPREPRVAARRRAAAGVGRDEAALPAAPAPALAAGAGSAARAAAAAACVHRGGRSAFAGGAARRGVGGLASVALGAVPRCRLVRHRERVALRVELRRVCADELRADLRRQAIAVADAGDAAPAVDRALQRGLALRRVRAVDLVLVELAHGAVREVQAVLPRRAVAGFLARLVTEAERAEERVIAVAVDDAGRLQHASRRAARRAPRSRKKDAPEDERTQRLHSYGHGRAV